MKVKVTLDNKWYHLDKIVNCIDGNELLGSIKKQSNKRCITFSGRAKRVNDEWVFEPNPKGKNFHRFVESFAPKIKESRIKLLEDSTVKDIINLFKLGKRKQVPLPVKLVNGQVKNIWINKYMCENTLRGEVRFYLPKQSKLYFIIGLVCRSDSGELTFIPYSGKHLSRFQQYLGVNVSPVTVDTLPFVSGRSETVILKPGVMGVVTLVYIFPDSIHCKFSFKFKGGNYVVRGLVYKGTNKFIPFELNKNYDKYIQYLESR